LSIVPFSAKCIHTYIHTYTCIYAYNTVSPFRLIRYPNKKSFRPSPFQSCLDHARASSLSFRLDSFFYCFFPGCFISFIGDHSSTRSALYNLEPFPEHRSSPSMSTTLRLGQHSQLKNRCRNIRSSPSISTI